MKQDLAADAIQGESSLVVGRPRGNLRALKTDKHPAKAEHGEQGIDFRQLLEANPFPVVVFDVASQSILQVSDAVVAQYGYTREELLKLRIADLWDSKDTPDVVEYLTVASATAQEVRSWSHKKKDGAIISVETAVSVVATASSTIAILNARPLFHAEQHAPDALSLSSVAHHSSDGLVLTDIKGRILDVNDAVLRVMGMNHKAELLGTNCLSLLLAEDQPRALANLQKRLLGAEVGRQSYDLILPHQGRCTIELNVVVLGEKSEQATGLLLSIRDVAARRQIEMRLDHQIALEEALARISRLLVVSTPSNMEQILQILGAALRANHSYFLRLHANDRSVVQALHLRCDNRGTRQEVDQDAVLLPALPWILGRVDSGDDFFFVDIDEPSDDAGPLSDLLHHQGVRSLLLVALRASDNTILGLLGFGDVEHIRGWPEEDIRCVRMVSEMLVSAWTRQHAEEALRQSEERYALAVRGTTDGIWDWNIRTGEVYFSPRWKELLGYQEHELEGWLDEWRKRVHPDDLMQMTAAVTAHLKGQSEYYESEYRILHKEGSYRWVLDRGVALRDGTGQPCRMAGSHTDITARKQTEVALGDRAREASFIAAIGTALAQSDSLSSMLQLCMQAIVSYSDAESVGVWILNRATNCFELRASAGKNTHIMLSSRIAGPQWRNDAGTHTNLAHLPYEFLAHAPSLSLEALKEETTLSFVPYPLIIETQIVGCMGLVVRRSLSLSTLDVLASVAHMIAVGIQRRIAEAELKEVNENLEQQVIERTKQIENTNDELAHHIAELRAVNRELESFSYSVSHDLRAPLRHINGFVDLLEKRAAVLDDKSRRYLGIIGDSARRMGSLIDGLLAFSRMGRAEMRKSRVSLEQLVKEVLLEIATDTRDREILWDISPLPDVEGDAALLRSVVSNLISNAVKYTRPRTPAQIVIGTVPTTERKVIWFVRDNGVGFDMQYADKLFGVFQRLHRAEEFEGTGIGLATVQRIVHRHGGRIWAEAEANCGATFYVALPINENRD